MAPTRPVARIGTIVLASVYLLLTILLVVHEVIDGELIDPVIKVVLAGLLTWPIGPTIKQQRERSSVSEEQ